jgi:radical SAM protein with 4Fe4S-binding SPASM domain
LGKNKKNEKTDQIRNKLLASGLDKFQLTQAHNWAGTIFSPTKNHTYKIKLPCPSPWSSLGILWDGTVVPCCLDINSEYILGNIFDESIEDIWNGSKIKFLRTQLSKNKIKGLMPCSRCHIQCNNSLSQLSKRILEELADDFCTWLKQFRKKKF